MRNVADIGAVTAVSSNVALVYRDEKTDAGTVTSEKTLVREGMLRYRMSYAYPRDMMRTVVYDIVVLGL